MSKSLFTPVGCLVSKKGGTNVIRSAPIRFSSTWTPTDDHDAATKGYVDTHGGASQQQQNIIYYSTAGPRSGVTADGLTLDSAFGDLADAVTAANAVAGVSTPYTVFCSDAAEVTLTQNVTIGGYVSLWAPNMQLIVEDDWRLVISDNAFARLYEFRGQLYLAPGFSSGMDCTYEFLGSILGAVGYEVSTLHLRCSEFRGIITLQYHTLLYLDCARATVTLNTSTHWSNVFIRCHSLVFLTDTPSVIDSTSNLYIDTDVLDYPTVQYLQVINESTAMIRAKNTVIPAATTWMTEGENSMVYLDYAMTHDVYTMTFDVKNPQGGIIASTTSSMLVYRMGNYSYAYFSGIYVIYATAEAVHVESATAIPARFLPRIADSTSAMTVISNGIGGCLATLDHSTGIITITGDLALGETYMFIPAFCIVTPVC
jgi:hypothetical protein